MGVPNSFLREEVRCGFLVPSQVKQAWAAELAVLAEIDRVCKKHQITYFADWGTFLGAVRHGGFVPWDDDIDIVMKREDYMKFMQVARFDMAEGFDVQTFRNQKDFWLFMGKVVGRNHFCFEKEHLRKFYNFPYIASVDIFVLDYMYRDAKKEEERRTLCKYMLGVADAIVEGSLNGARRERSLQTVEEMYGGAIERKDDPTEMGRYLYGLVEEVFARVQGQDADMLTQLFPWGLKGRDFAFPKEYYANPVCVPFENTQMPVPQHFDRMLRKRYGEYWRLVKNAGAHDYPFFEGQKKNLLKVLDFDLPEFRFSPDMLERKPGEEGSMKQLLKECFEEFERLWEKANAAAETETALGLLGQCQQLAMDMGALTEQVKGEGTLFVAALETVCDALYELYAGLSQERARGEYTQMAEAAIRQAKEELSALIRRRSVVFFPLFAKDWQSMNGLYENEAGREDTDVYVVPLPYYYKDYDGSAKELCYEGDGFGQVRITDYRVFTKEYLELLEPECIVIQSPYDQWNPAYGVPEQFYAASLKAYTKQLWYVPPFAPEDFAQTDYRQYFNMQYYAVMPGVVHADKVLLPSQEMRKRYLEKLTEFSGDEYLSVWEKKIQAQEKEAPAASREEGQKRLCFGISLGTYAERGEQRKAFLREKFGVLCQAGERLKTEVVLYPPVFEAAKKEEIMAVLMEFPEISLADEAFQGGCQYAETAYDAYYGDPMPLLMEFATRNKPVMVAEV